MTRVESKGSSNHLRLEHAIKHNAVVQSLYRYGMSGVFQIIGKFIRTDPNLVLMNGHSYKYNDSPRAIYRKMCELGMDKQYKIVWALNDPDGAEIPGNAAKVKMDTPEYFKTALKAKYWISCVGIERGLHFKKKNQIYLNTWHGAAINVSGNGVPGRNDFHWGHIDYFCMCGKLDEINFGRDMELNPKSYLRCGYPRNDVLSSITPELQKEVRKKLGLPEGKKFILYAPTWRDSQDGGDSFQLAPPIDWDKWKKKLSDKYIVLLRTHPYTTKLMNMKFNDFVLDFTSYPEVNDLLIAANILISDYSSILLDYCITEKPMICFGYDIEEYKRVRGGFYYDLDKEMPNGVMKNEDQIIEHLLNLDYEAECEKTKFFKKNHCEYEKGHATVACINAVFGTNY